MAARAVFWTRAANMRHVVRWLCAFTVLGAALIGATDLRSEDLLESAKQTAERVEAEQGPGSVETAKAWQDYGDLLGNQGRKADAAAAIRKALAIRLRVLGENDTDTAYTLNQLGWALESTDGNSAAEPYFRRALA